MSRNINGSHILPPCSHITCHIHAYAISLLFLSLRCKTIHTDLKPENVALETPSRVVRAIMENRALDTDDKQAEKEWLRQVMRAPDIRIVDFGNACWTNKHFTDDIQTTQYRAPEVIIRTGYGTPCDVWSVACILFELATGDQLFHPKAGRDYSKDDDHIALTIELLGHWPKAFAKGGKRSREFFNGQGRPKAISRLEMWSLENVLHEKYEMTEEDARDFAGFLLPMLVITPKGRATAEEMLKHPWLSVQEAQDSTDPFRQVTTARDDESEDVAVGDETESNESAPA